MRPSRLAFCLKQFQLPSYILTSSPYHMIVLLTYNNDSVDICWTWQSFLPFVQVFCCLHINTGTWAWCSTWSLTLPSNIRWAALLSREPVIIISAWFIFAIRRISTFGLPWINCTLPWSWNLRKLVQGEPMAEIMSSFHDNPYCISFNSALDINLTILSSFKKGRFRHIQRNPSHQRINDITRHILFYRIHQMVQKINNLMARLVMFTYNERLLNSAFKWPV